MTIEEGKKYLIRSENGDDEVAEIVQLAEVDMSAFVSVDDEEEETLQIAVVKLIGGEYDGNVTTMCKHGKKDPANCWFLPSFPVELQIIEEVE